MSLDPQAEQVLRKLHEAGFVPFCQLSVTNARRQLRDLRRPTEVQPLATVLDREIDTVAGRFMVRDYRSNANQTLPILLYMHGGGWVMGDLDSHDALCRGIAHGSGCAVISVDYPLAPEHPFPAAPEACYAVVDWLAKQGQELGLDPTRMAVAGDSAGGNLAAALCLMARDRGGPSLASQILIYPITDNDPDTPSYLENASDKFLSRDDMIWFWSQYLSGATVPVDDRATPLRADSLHGLPPALIITAEADTLRDDGGRYAEKLMRDGVDTHYLCYPGMVHGFLAMAAVIDKGREAIAQVCKELRVRLQVDEGQEVNSDVVATAGD